MIKSENALDLLREMLADALRRLLIAPMPIEAVDRRRVDSLCIRNKRRSLEDRIAIYHDAGSLCMDQQSATSGAATMLLGVFDGHNGAFAAEYARKHLVASLARQAVRSAATIRDAFLEADDRICRLAGLQVREKICS